MFRKVSLSRAPWLVKLLPLLLLLGACATGAIREKQLTLPVIDGATSVGQEACVECHEGMSAGVHSRLAGFEYMGGTQGCEACHGGGSLHIDSADNSQILKFDDLLPEESAAVCAKCHTDGKLMDWTHGEHALSDVSCNDCHSIHGGGKTALKQQDPELCYTCHQEQMAKANFPSHHPIKEGKMNCSDCHNPHGELQTEELARDTCLNCHARYQGPFVFEHAPVEEDCSVCHDPHGTIANNLLVQNEPFLCLQCHESHFHTTRIGGTVPVTNVSFSATDSAGNPATPLVDPSPDTTTSDTVTSDPGFASDALTTGMAASDPLYSTVEASNAHGEDGWRQAFGTKCTVCHSVVHGSDHPTQSAPTVNPANNYGFPDGAKGLTR